MQLYANTTVHSGPPSPAYANGLDLSTPLHHPSSSSRFSHPAKTSSTPTSLVRAVLEPILALLPRLKRRSKRERLDEGLLAPRTPVRGSPLHTPVRMGSFAAAPGSNSGGGSYFPWGQDEGGQGQGTSSSSVYTSAAGGGGGGVARPRTPSSSTFASPEKKPSMYGALALDLSADISASGSTGSGNPLAASGPSHPPPRRVQSEALVPGAGGRNPRGIATRNGRPALEDATPSQGAGEGRKSDVLPPMSMSRPTSPGQHGTGGSEKKSRSPPRVSLGPHGGQKLEGAEIVESQGLTKKKAD